MDPDVTRRLALLWTGLLTTVLAVGGALLVAPPTASAGPGSGTPYVVALGDSYISGEAGRWAGSSNDDADRADALGDAAYHDGGGGEAIERCHRSASAEIHIGTVASANLACSGAETATYTTSEGWFKPGLDFYDDGAGHVGQALALQQLATAQDVELVVVSIGGNDFGFGAIVQQCVEDFLTSPSWDPDYCSDDGSVTDRFTPGNVDAVTARIAGALQNVRTAMTNAGYSDADWRLLVQTYPSPIPNGAGFRYQESGFTRQSTGGCGFWDADADWANASALPTINGAVLDGLARSGLTNASVLDLGSAFDGRRLCETGVGLYEEVGLPDWHSAGAVDATEWVNQIRTVSTIGSDYYVQESLHPNYWGQLAVRNCVRQAFLARTGGTCTRSGNGLVGGEPQMALQ